MADHHTSHAVDNDYREHEATYARFLSMAKWGTVLTVIVVLFIGSMTSLVPWALTIVAAAALVGAAKLM